VRLVLSPRPDRLAVVVRTVTETLLDADGSVPAELVSSLEPVLLPQLPPLCLPLGTGAGLASHPANGMAFGEYRCHLIALALRRRVSGDALAAIATVFGAHGIDAAAPHRGRR
jgi:hypothetical protein